MSQHCVLTIGNFDGVHRGHAAIGARARELADREDVPLIALTFEPHPLEVLRSGQGPRRLTTPEQKLAALHALGFDRTVVIPSTPDFLAISADDFVRDVIVTRFLPLHVVEGRNFGYGRGRQGSVDTLREAGRQLGFEVHVVEPVQQQLADGTDERVSSSLIRQLLIEGQVEIANQALGRSYELTGEVVTGNRRGRLLGFPTANVAVNDVLVPADGVYAAAAHVHGRTWKAAVSIGRTPTFGGEERQIEAHLLEFDGDLYDQAMTLHMLRRLRDQRKFASQEELVKQLESDVQAVGETRI
jgi:riboflavin kinase/FMN adenylyltransferase